MKVRLNRAPYYCGSVIEVHTGEKDGSFLFDQSWLGAIMEVELLKEDEQTLTIKIPTYYEGVSGGWIICQVIRECFDIVC